MIVIAEAMWPPDQSIEMGKAEAALEMIGLA